MNRLKNIKKPNPLRRIKSLNKYFGINDVIDVVIIGSGLNYYKRIDWNTETVKINDFEYVINRRKLFVPPRNALVRFKDRIRRRRNIYQIIFKEGLSEAVALPPLSRKDPSSDILFIAERSTALKKGLEELFSSSLFSGKAVIFIVIVIGIIAFAYLYATGQLPEIALPI